MLSFFRARPTRSPPSTSPLRAVEWSGSELVLRVSPALVGECVAIDLDGCFFADAPVAADGCACFRFPSAPKARGETTLLPRRARDGEPLVEAPFAIAFGRAGASLAGGPASLEALGDIGPIVPFGTDCSAHEVAIVVPVYGAPALVERCLDSVLEHTTGRARLIVIDDASPDAAIAPLLDRYANRANVAVLRNPRNLGFTATANRGIAEAGRADVVLLNADTEVGPNWLTGLRRAACRDDVATVTAVSDNAGAFSVPELEQENALPAGWTFEQTARALWQHAGHAYPELPTGNGFCMYIRRAVIDAVGALDEAAFPQGYGEENDFCQRASARGWRHRIAGNVFVRHARSASFGHERRSALGAAGMAILRERWPSYEADVATSLHSYERRVLDWRVRRIFAFANAMAPRRRVLVAGDDLTLRDCDVLRLHDEGGGVDLRRGASVIVSHAPRGGDRDAEPISLEEQLWSWLQAYAIEAVVAGANAPAALPDLARALGIPFARASRDDDADRALAHALEAARSFAEFRR